MINFHFISDVYDLLRDKEFEKFDEIVRIHPQIINSLRDDVFDETLLMNVVNHDDDDVFDHLINIPQDFNVVNGNGQNIIRWIAWSNDDRGVRRLIKLSNKTNVGSLINQQDIDGRTPLHVAARLNNHQMIKQLIEFRCDVNVRDEWNYLPDEHDWCDEVTKKLIRQAR